MACICIKLGQTNCWDIRNLWMEVMGKTVIVLSKVFDIRTMRVLYLFKKLNSLKFFWYLDFVIKNIQASPLRTSGKLVHTSDKLFKNSVFIIYFFIFSVIYFQLFSLTSDWTVTIPFWNNVRSGSYTYFEAWYTPCHIYVHFLKYFIFLEVEPDLNKF